jgi:DNA-binding GntR family transcriptional regulator
MLLVKEKRAAMAARNDLLLSEDSIDHDASFNLHEKIYEMLRRALIRGDFMPGHSFPMRALADHFGTSLIPVRDALKRLVAERALRLLPNRTVCVPLMSRSSFQELLQVRLSLEPQLTRRATELISFEDVAGLESTNRVMGEAASRLDPKGYLTANYEFHFALYRAARSEVALPIVESLWMRVGPFLHGVFRDSEGSRIAIDHHEEILAAVRRRDPIRAAEAVVRDLSDAADTILARVEFVSDRMDTPELSASGRQPQTPSRRAAARDRRRASG